MVIDFKLQNFGLDMTTQSRQVYEKVKLTKCD